LKPGRRLCRSHPRHLWGFLNIDFFPGLGLSALCPTPNLEDQGVSFCLGHHLWPVRLGWPCQ
jgi:hypothetical protein